MWEFSYLTECVMAEKQEITEERQSNIESEPVDRRKLMGNQMLDVLQGKEDNYILPFFWQHGEDEKTLCEYVHAIHDTNIGAFCVESRPHPDFCGPKWWQDMDVILDEAKKLSMKVWILDDSHFPTGMANCAVRKAPKELHHLYLCSNTVEMAGPAPQIEVDLMSMIHPDLLPLWITKNANTSVKIHDDRLVHVYLCPVDHNSRIGEPKLLDDQIRDGRLVVDLPEGYWRIFVVYSTYDAQGRNDYINFMDKDSCHLQIEAVYEPHWEHYKDLFGNVIAGFFSDEPPVGNVPGYNPAASVGTDPQMAVAWSRSMQERMNQSYGSQDWEKLLPYLWGLAADRDSQARECAAYMDAATRLVQECFSDQLGNWCADHNVMYIGHMLEDVDMNSRMGPSVGHYFRGLDGQHMAGIDNIGNSLEVGAQDVGRHNPYSRMEADFYYYVLGKLAATHASIDERKAGRSMCENFGAYGWETGVSTMKYLLDEFLVRGVNHYVPHAFTPKAFPDPDCPPHFYAHGENPEYKGFGQLMRYANRVCHLISNGKEHPSVALLYHAESDWMGSYERNGIAARALTRGQIDYHILPADVFLETDKYHTEFDGKVLRVNGVEYRALILSGGAYLCRAAAAFILKAGEFGFPIVCTGRMPARVGDCTDKEKENLNRALSLITAVPEDHLAGWLREQGICDVTAVERNEDLTVFHYDNGHQTYLVLNENPGKVFDGQVAFGTSGKPWLYDAWTNELHGMEAGSAQDCTFIRMHLEPLELAIIVFDLTEQELDGVEEGRTAELIAADAENRGKVLCGFQVRRAENKEYPDFHDAETAGEDGVLTSMAERHPDFSGWYRYETTAELENGCRTVLAIDNAYECVDVTVNGQRAGSRVARPYVFDITRYVQKGSNQIQINVATTLERKIRAMGLDTNCMNIHHPLAPTGIVGRVRIIQNQD